MRLCAMAFGCLLAAAAAWSQQAKPATSSRPASAGKLDAMVERELPGLVTTYKALHAAPELSHHEDKTAALLAQKLRMLGYDVTEHVGKYEKPEWQGHGIVALMKNGSGPTVLVRADMDALPVDEQTGLEYASHEDEE